MADGWYVQDGTVLCHALNVLKAESVTMIHEKPTKQVLLLMTFSPTPARPLTALLPPPMLSPPSS